MLYRGNKPFVRVADSQLWYRKATVPQAMEDALIGFRRFFRHRLNGKDITLSVFIYTTDDGDRFTDDMSIDANILVKGICPKNRISNRSRRTEYSRPGGPLEP